MFQIYTLLQKGSNECLVAEHSCTRLFSGSQFSLLNMGLNQKAASATNLQHSLEGRPYPRLDVLKNSITTSQYIGWNTNCQPWRQGRGEAQDPGARLWALSCTTPAFHAGILPSQPQANPLSQNSTRGEAQQLQHSHSGHARLASKSHLPNETSSHVSWSTLATYAIGERNSSRDFQFFLLKGEEWKAKEVSQH